jgi:hypothetical protein
VRRGRRIAAAILWTTVVAVWATLLRPGQVYMCLGPLDITEASCRAANGMPRLTEWDRFVNGVGLPAMIIAAGWAVVLIVDRRKRQRGGL